MCKIFKSAWDKTLSFLINIVPCNVNIKLICNYAYYLKTLTFNLIFRIDDTYKYNHNEYEYLIQEFYALTRTHIKDETKNPFRFPFSLPIIKCKHVFSVWGNVVFAQNILYNSVLCKKEKMICCEIINYLTYYKFSLVSAIWALMLWFSIIVLKALKTVFLCWHKL